MNNPPSPLNSEEVPNFFDGKSWVPDKDDHLASRLADILLSENLIVLAGLGTSLCLRDPKSPDDPSKSRAPKMGDLWQDIENSFPSIEEIKSSNLNLEGIRKRVKYTVASGSENIEDLLSNCQMYLSLNEDKEVEAFTKHAEARIRALCSFDTDELSLRWHKAFLLKAGRRSTRQPRMKLFTTNYDRCFEEAANFAKFLVIDGFSHTVPQQFDGSQFGYDFVRRDHEKDVPDYIPNVFHLYKLHGSIDWDREEVGSRRVLKVANPKNPAMIFPRQGKFELSYHQPYFEMMSRLQAALRQPKTGLIIVGFGFNDNHITEPIRAALDSNVGLKCCVINPGFKEYANSQNPGENAMMAYTLRLIAEGDKRILAIRSTFEQIVPIIPDLVATTEQERHEQRVQKARV